HQYRKFFLGNGVYFVGCTNDAMSQTAGFIEGLEMNWIIGVAIELEQGLVDPLEEAHHVLPVVRLFKNAYPYTAELGPTLHQRLIAQQHGLAEEPGIIQKNRVNSAGPFHSFFKQGNSHIDAHV